MIDMPLNPPCAHGLDNPKKMKVGGLFAGIGGIELGFKKAGFEIAWANEIDKNACITYRNNHSHPLFEKDINQLDTREVQKIDILTGGFPCHDNGNTFKVIMQEPKSRGYCIKHKQIGNLVTVSVVEAVAKKSRKLWCMDENQSMESWHAITNYSNKEDV